MKLTPSGNTLTEKTSKISGVDFFVARISLIHGTITCKMPVVYTSGESSARMQDYPDISRLNQVPNALVINYCIVRPRATYLALSAKQPN